jgi:hypothetical protein
MCEDGAIGRGSRALARHLLSTGTGADPCPAGQRGESRVKNFFNGTKLPISLKTKGRGARLRKTKLPFAPSAGSRQEEETLARRFS